MKELPAVPVRLLGDRILLSTEGEDGERRSGSGIVIPATASMGRRLGWATVVAVGPNVRHVVRGDRHGVSEAPTKDEGTGLYL